MKKLSCILILVIGFLLAHAQDKTNLSMADIIKNPPSPARLVNDYAGILTADQKQTLEHKLVRLDDSTFTQIAVVIVRSLDGYDVADAAIELGRSWGVGNKKNNSGVVLLISKNDRKLNISPGYGLEGALTDAEASNIISDIIRPNFKGDDYYRGINEGTDAIIKAVQGEYHTARAKKSKAPSGKIIFIIIIIIFLLISGSGGNKGGTFLSRRGSRGLAGPLLWGSMLGGGGSGGGWGGGGGGSSGGFGGFGGGSFGGGGSSGSW
jgi:uncharacterized protein